MHTTVSIHSSSSAGGSDSSSRKKWKQHQI